MLTKLVNRILLVNDDGFDAPGIKLLQEVAKNSARGLDCCASDRSKWCIVFG